MLKFLDLALRSPLLEASPWAGFQGAWAPENRRNCKKSVDKSVERRFCRAMWAGAEILCGLHFFRPGMEIASLMTDGIQTKD